MHTFQGTMLVTSDDACENILRRREYIKEKYPPRLYTPYRSILYEYEYVRASLREYRRHFVLCNTMNHLICSFISSLANRQTDISFSSSSYTSRSFYPALRKLHYINSD